MKSHTKKRLFILSAVFIALLLPLLLTKGTQAGKFAARALGSFAQAPQWPTLPEQLTKSRVQPGSALEQLIKDNQDFSILRDDEASDLRRLPPWLRVWWRKAHPELKYTASDPTGGYPLVLKEILEWMESHQDLKPGPGTRSFAGEREKEEQEREEEEERLLAPNSTITGEQRISGAQSAPRSESDIRINFFDPTKILSASNNISGSGMQAQFYSTDSGATWLQSSLPLQSGDAFHSDPTVDWTSDGRGWSSTIGINSGASVLRLRNYFTSDNGATWTFDATFSGTQTSADKQIVWADHNAASPFFNRQYAIWHNGLPAFMNRRTAGAGGSWLANPIQVSGAESTGTAIGGDVKTNSAGHVFGFWPTTTNRRIFVVKSTNGGDSYGTPVQIATTFDGFDIGVPSFNGRRALIYVSAAAYKPAGKDLVYATWTDLSGDAGCTAAANEPGSNVASTCKTRIWFSRSTDGGATWSAAVKINNQAGLNDQFNQWLAVDETTGALGVMYYDTVGDAGRKKVDIWYQHSFDDGVSWSAAEKVTTAQTVETTGGQDSGNQFGDYNGLSAYAGVLFPSWTDRRGGAREEIWTAKISDPACTFPGAPAIGTATATAPNQIQVTWTNGLPAAATFNVYRAVGTCASPGAFTLIASNVAGLAYTDTTVSGGTTYSYRITGLDATGNCESPQSACVQATATGACTLPPAFAGLTSVTNAETAACTLNLAWSAATANCGGPISYNIYRSTSTGFAPAPGNLIATTAATSYSDTGGLMSGVTYFYIVRAVDTSNSVSETNTVQRSGTPTGPVSVGTLTETFEGALSGGGFDNAGWTHQALTGAVDWVYSTSQSQTPTHSWFSDSLASTSDRVLVSPPFVVGASTTLSFWHTFAFEGTVAQCFDGGTLEYSTNGTTWTVMPDANFTAGGFNGTVNSGFSNPIAGRRAYCAGTIGAMTQVTLNLASLAGNTIQLRWHAGDDSSAQATGWFVDSVTIANAGVASACSMFSCPTITGTVSGNATICTAGSTNVTVMVSGGMAPYTVTMTNGGGTQTGMGPVFTFPVSPGGTTTYAVAAGSQDANNCPITGSGSATVIVNPIPPTPTITPGGPTTFCAGGSVTLTSSSAMGNQWFLNGNSIGGATNQTFVATASGNYTVVVTAGGCPSAPSAPTTVTVNPAPPTPTVAPGGPTSLCTGGSVTLTSSSATGNQWFLNGNSIGGATNQTYIATASGSYTVVVTASGCSSAASAPTVVTINPIPPTPTITPSGSVTFCAGSSVTLTSSSATGNQWFLNGNPIVGAINQTYVATAAGSYTVVATVNGCSSAHSAATTLTATAITVNPASLPGGTVGTGYSQTVSASPAGAYSFTITNGVMPAGLTLNAATGVISGTPTAAGSFSFRVTATLDGCSGFRDYTAAIGCSTISLSPASLPAGTAGAAYSQTVSVSPAGSYTFSLAQGSLPSGLTLNPATGVISGLPSLTGTVSFIVKAQTASGCSATQTYSLAINCPPTVTLSPATLPNGLTGTAYSQALSVSPAGGNYTFAVTPGGLPTGLNLNPSTGILSGTPAASGTFTFTVTATGYGGCTGNRSYTVTIGTGSCPVVTLPASLPNGSLGQLYSNSAVASPSGSYNYTAAGNLPPGTTLYNSIGLIFGYPTTPGSFTFTITATAGACSGSQQYTVLIGAGFMSSLTVFSDFDGDGKSDLSVWRGKDGNWLVANSGDGQLQSTPWGAGYAPYNDLTVPGDYDGDGKTDLAVFRRGGDQAGYWYIRRSSNGQVMRQQWGLGTDLPVPGDYDGDGKTDIAVWRGLAGAWYILRSSDSGVEGITWGIASLGDIPVPGDYDGDGKTDPAVFRRSDGYWHLKRSSDAAAISSKWGVGTDIAVPGDYDGDGRTDLAVWRPSDGNWYVAQSSNAAIFAKHWATGVQGDIPVLGDFDGDGKADFAVWNETTGVWLVNGSRDNSTISRSHGQVGDVPTLSRRN